MSAARFPLSTYRQQFNSEFTFTDARETVGYLHALGISECYASSYFAAAPGSPHGYDVADPTRLNPEIGTEADYWAWIDSLTAEDMGHILDLVPNHMGIARSANPWWLDVLENGPSSRYAAFFDIAWHPVKDELANKVLIPILGGQYGEVLERQELTLAYRDGAFAVRYVDETLPIAPDTLPAILQPVLEPWLTEHAGQPAAEELQSVLTASEHLPPRSSRDPASIATRAREKEVVKRRLAQLADDQPAVRALIDRALDRLNGVPGRPRSFDLLDELLDRQSYRLAHWRVASEEINYRRFFDVNQLAALRMEDPTVFDAVHRFAFELVERGAATGLRIDHVDGLYEPAAYLSRLQDRCSRDGCPFYIVVEKILGSAEELPDWPVSGTTGYEFARVVNNLFVDRRNAAALDAIYTRFTRGRTSFSDLVYSSKKQTLHETMSGDINSLGHQLNRFSERNRHFRDFTLYSLISTLKEVIACFPVYRTYVTESAPVSERDRRYIAEAVRCAKRRNPSVTPLVFEFIERLLLKETPASTVEACEERARFIGKFQQITGPIAAKGIEDSALYVYNRLLSLNEVGSDPTVVGMDPAAVHDWFACRQRRWPRALSTTSTHDTKRGEDVRARLNVLSEIPGAWKAAVTRWRASNRRHKTDISGKPAPSANEEYFIYQSLLGAWPSGPVDAQHGADFRARFRAYMVKALREAKVNTSWLRPDEAYEQAVLRFVDAILDRRRANTFLQTFIPFQARVAELGIYNSLSQLLIKIAAPGIPDFYQGTELWDLNLVDPDNRRPVDYDRRRQLLASLACGPMDHDRLAQLLADRADGRVKMFVIHRALRARAAAREVFERGDYVPLSTGGRWRECVFAFARRLGTRVAVACVPRLVSTLTPDPAGPPIGHALWGDTTIDLPVDGSARFCDVFTGTAIETEPDHSQVLAGSVFEQFPVALLLSE